MKRRSFMALLGLAPVIGAAITKVVGAIPKPPPPVVNPITGQHISGIWIQETTHFTPSKKLFELMMEERRKAESVLRDSLDKFYFEETGLPQKEFNYPKKKGIKYARAPKKRRSRKRA